MDMNLGAGAGTADQAAETGLVVDRVVKHYGRVEVLHDVSLGIEPGRFVTLLGPSGSGKSTLLMCIAGFEEVGAGDIRLDGRSLRGLPPEKRDFGMVFQGYALFPHLTVAENIAFPLRIRGVGRAERESRVRAALSMVRMDGLADRLPRQISGGQQQRVALARAIVFEPRVLLLDEPLSALDRGLRAEMQEELKRLHGELALSFIYVTHDQEEALFLSDKVAILNFGRIQQVGDPATLYSRPVNRFVAGFLGRSNLIELSGRVISGVFIADPAGSPFAVPPRLEAPGRDDGPCRLTACHRPERAQLAAPGEGEGLALDGEIAQVAYHGTTLEVALRLADGSAFHVSLLNRGVLPQRGERARVLLDPGSLVPLADG
ncbi:ABC transporter ATP-binding protein [Falsiroseomonas oryzae]|uniref:ABC transporter ATP-binding protein n=1 Tax=Falsiroseomonas oryzae TaxID=2766473 RepID=UPI0022EB7AAD|nr:ABC transporter ATP-binding protein [Roseomonas sp. MO-31]